MENELTDKLLTKREIERGYHIAFQEMSLLRGDTNARAEYYNKLYYLGAMSSNDIRKSEGMLARIGGDEYVTAVNLYTQEQVELNTEKTKKEIELMGKEAPQNTEEDDTREENISD